jgi:hypothetical protein
MSIRVLLTHLSFHANILLLMVAVEYSHTDNCTELLGVATIQYLKAQCLENRLVSSLQCYADTTQLRC